MWAPGARSCSIRIERGYEEKNLKAEKLLQVMSMLGAAPEDGL